MIRQEMLFIVVASSWTPTYSALVKAMGLQDKYERFVVPWQEIARQEGCQDEELGVEDVFEDMDDDLPGDDIWGVLYHVAHDKGTNKFASRLVNVKRLASEDYPDFSVILHDIQKMVKLYAWRRE